MILKEPLITTTERIAVDIVDMGVQEIWHLAKTRFSQASKERQKGLVTKGQGQIFKRPDSVAGSTQRY